MSQGKVLVQYLLVRVLVRFVFVYTFTLMFLYTEYKILVHFVRDLATTPISDNYVGQ